MTERWPNCNHLGEQIGRIAWPTGIPGLGVSHASTYVCGRGACQADATEWVEEVTGHRGELVPFRTEHLDGGRGPAALGLGGVEPLDLNSEVAS